LKYPSTATTIIASVLRKCTPILLGHKVVNEAFNLWHERHLFVPAAFTDKFSHKIQLLTIHQLKGFHESQSYCHKVTAKSIGQSVDFSVGQSVRTDTTRDNKKLKTKTAALLC
jgi:hypothetical protein